MAAYLIAEVKVTDPAGYERYRPLAAASIAKHGGKYLVRGGGTEALEGEPWQRIVVLEFPSMDAARKFYNSPDYQEAIKMRKAASVGRIALIEGYSGN